MNQYYKPNEEGFFDGDTVLADTAPDGYYEGWVQPFHKPKWDGNAWVEGSTAEELSEIEAKKALATAEVTNKRSLEDTLSLLQDEMRAWVALSNSTITEADMKKGIKLVMRVLIKLIRLVLNRLEGLE